MAKNNRKVRFLGKRDTWELANSLNFDLEVIFLGAKKEIYLIQKSNPDKSILYKLKI